MPHAVSHVDGSIALSGVVAPTGRYSFNSRNEVPTIGLKR